MDNGTRFKRSSNITWKEKIIDEPMEKNIFSQQLFKPQSTTDGNFVIKEQMEENYQDIPKPGARYGHAACKYQGQ